MKKVTLLMQIVEMPRNCYKKADIMNWIDKRKSNSSWAERKKNASKQLTLIDIILKCSLHYHASIKLPIRLIKLIWIFDDYKKNEEKRIETCEKVNSFNIHMKRKKRRQYVCDGLLFQTVKQKIGMKNLSLD